MYRPEGMDKKTLQSYYVFQVRKCQDRAFCLDPVVPEDDMKWLPDPILGELGEHYKAFEDIYE